MTHGLSVRLRPGSPGVRTAKGRSMVSLVKAVHEHHLTLRAELVRLTAKIEHEQPVPTGKALVRFLTEELLPHARGEEKELYPAVDPLVKLHGSSTATMSLDHERIIEMVDRVDQIVQKLGSARGTRKTALARQLARLSIQLEAILLLHLDKEETVYLPLLERYLPSAAQSSVLKRLHEG